MAMRSEAGHADHLRWHGLRPSTWWRACLLLVMTGASTAIGGAAASPDRQAQQDVLLASLVEAGYPGARMIVVRDGRTLVDAAVGHADLARTQPLHRDAIYRIYSMTKPVVSAAVLRFVAEGRARLDDPVSLHLPGLADLQVMTADGHTRAPRRALTLRHLLTHTTGFPVSPGPALRLREAAGLEDSPDLAGYVSRLADVPLAGDPGSRFDYDSIATEVLGRLLEVWSGQPLDAHLREVVFEPLGMTDTGFEVPAAHRHRVVALGRMLDGRLVAHDAPHARAPGTRLRAYPGAAGGLYATAADYLAFARMLLDGGRVGSGQWLPRALVEDMLTDQLQPMGLAVPYVDDRPGQGFGLGVSVLLDPPARERTGAAGQAGWSGAASTWFVIDPATRSIGVLLLQHVRNGSADDLPPVSTRFYNHVQQVISK